ncbi:MAG: DUF6133 family protein [Oscillospiraceae bacterium]|nr:DUF6133 family protein [Oscillospiraceae bacterium]
MRNIFKKAKAKIIGAVTFVKSAVCRRIQRTRAAAYRLAVRSNAMLAASRGENFVDSGIKILIAVVIGALLLGGLYALFGDTIMPTVTEKVKSMFDFKG